MLSSDCRANRPHLGLCPEANVPLQGAWSAAVHGVPKNQTQLNEQQQIPIMHDLQLFTGMKFPIGYGLKQ